MITDPPDVKKHKKIGVEFFGFFSGSEPGTFGAGLLMTNRYGDISATNVPNFMKISEMLVYHTFDKLAEGFCDKFLFGEIVPIFRNFQYIFRLVVQKQLPSLISRQQQILQLWNFDNAYCWYASAYTEPNLIVKMPNGRIKRHNFGPNRPKTKNTKASGHIHQADFDEIWIVHAPGDIRNFYWWTFR